MVRSPSGYPMQSPYIGIANRQTEIMLRIAAEFGLTATSRARIALRRDDEPDLFHALRFDPDVSDIDKRQ